MLRLYYAACGKLDETVDDSRFSDYRREKLAHTRAPELRKQMIAAELLLIRAVQEANSGIALPLQICTDESGKPYFPNSPLHLNLSHSAERVCCALSDHEVGLDVQKIRNPHDAMLRRCFSAEEQRYIQESVDPAARFTLLWCVKESYVKAKGEGLSSAFDSLELSLINTIRINTDRKARFWTWEGAEYQTALCTLDGSDPYPDRVEFVELGR